MQLGIELLIELSQVEFWILKLELSLYWAKLELAHLSEWALKSGQDRLDKGDMWLELKLELDSLIINEPSSYELKFKPERPILCEMIKLINLTPNSISYIVWNDIYALTNEPNQAARVGDESSSLGSFIYRAFF